MKLILKITLVIAVAIIALAMGLVAGTYYHNEILVIWKNVIVDHDISPSPIALPSINLDETSVINLPGLEENLPLVYSETLEEDQIQQYLKEGAVVLPLGTSFGEPGNVVVTAHSSGTTAFGPYRFAFAKLSELEIDQEYTISTPQANYTYNVYKTEIVWPHEVDKLPADDRSTVTLVTCWPLWTNLQRLLVHTELVNVEFKI